MKTLLAALMVFTGALATGQTLDIVTPNQTFRGATVTRVEAEGIRILHSEGAAVIDFDDLPAALQLHFGWTPEKSAARKAARAAKVAEEKRIEDEKRRIAEEPKRLAEEAAAKERAIKAKEEAEAAAKAKAEYMEDQKELLAAAAKVRADIDRERGGPVPVNDAIPVAVLLPEGKSDGQGSGGIIPPASAAPWEANPSLWNLKLAIGFIIAGAALVVLFYFASIRNPIRVVIPPRRENAAGSDPLPGSRQQERR